MIKLPGLLRGLFHQPADAGFDPLQLGVRDANRLQFSVSRGFDGFGHERNDLLSAAEMRTGKAR